jgi:tol-pal system protein YbgF
VCLLGGCASSETAADRQFSKLNEAVSKMQADHDRFDQRLGALEISAADEARARATAPASAAGPGPARNVVQLGGPTDEGEDPSDPSQRPEIRVVGPGGGAPARPVRGKSTRGRLDDADASSAGSVGGLGSDSARPSALDPEAKKAYEAALAKVQAKQYERGLEGLNAFLVRWPDHPYAENAMYWRGEAYFAQGEYLRAAEQFEAVLARFSGGNKAADALLKLGMCHDRLGASSRAREYWDRLKNEYPRSDAAKRIPAGGSPKGPKESR